MHERADRLAGNIVTVDEDLAREFEARLVESSTLAFRVAFSVLRQREDAEDVAQEAFAKAYRSFRQLRDRDRFRAWLVRMTWRMALDRHRTNKRRLAREGEEAGLQTRLAIATTTDAVLANERAEQLCGTADGCRSGEPAHPVRGQRHHAQRSRRGARRRVQGRPEGQQRHGQQPTTGEQIQDGVRQRGARVGARGDPGVADGDANRRGRERKAEPRQGDAADKSRAGGPGRHRLARHADILGRRRH